MATGQTEQHTSAGSASQGATEVLLERVSDAFVALDRNWVYTYVNRRAASIFGRRPEDMVGKHIWTEFPEGVGQPFYHAYHRALETQQYTFIEEYYKPYERWFENRIYPSPDGVSIFFHDITDRKRAESLLVGQKQILEAIAIGTPLEQSLVALVQLIERHTPEMMCSVLLLDADRKHVRHGAAPSVPAAFMAAIEGAEIGPRAGSCGTAAYRKEPVFVEDIATDPLWTDYRTLALSHGLRACWSTPIVDAQQRVLGTFAMYFATPRMPSEHERAMIEIARGLAAVAITRRRNEDALRTSESRFRSLVQSNLIGVMIADLKGQILEANDELLRIAGASRASLEQGRLRWDEMTPEDLRSFDLEVLARLEQSGVAPTYEKVYVNGRGERVPVRITAVMLEGEARQCIALVEDITELKEQEQMRYRNAELEERNRLAAESSRLKSEFVAGMSHELRTPLNAVIGFSEFLSDEKPGPLNAKQKEYLDDILSSGRHLLELINEVLDLAKVEAGKLELHAEPCSLHEQLEDACAVARGMASKKGITIQLETDAAIDAVTLDPPRFKQVLFNLLSNAVKFTGRGGRIDVCARRFDDERFEVRVRDTGIGIRAADLGKLFREFQQLDAGATREHEGTGLGLALTKRLVEAQRGSIGVESEHGKGSCFYFVMPRTVPAVAEDRG